MENLCNNINNTTKDENAQDTQENNNTENEQFYENAEKYWSNVPATVNGMLGGFGCISTTDLTGSRQFLKKLFNIKNPPGRKRVLDCGAGIGRITKGLLMDMFETVDMVEQDKAFCEKAKEEFADNSKIGSVFNEGLQKFTPQNGVYNVVWCQWVLGHLTDEDLKDFFKRISNSLDTNGILVVKENVTSSNCLERDDVDSSVTRPLATLKKLIKAANFQIVQMERQNSFPTGIYPVYMLACKPIKQ